MGEDMEASLREQRFAPRIKRTWVRFLSSLHLAMSHSTNSRKKDVHTIITLTDNAPQGLNDSLSSFPLATKVRPTFTFFHALWNNDLFPS
jgi:hypothetical protein